MSCIVLDSPDVQHGIYFSSETSKGFMQRVSEDWEMTERLCIILCAVAYGFF